MNKTTLSTQDREWPVVSSGACRSHPTWPWLIIDADGGIYDAKLKRYRKQYIKHNGYKSLGINGQNYGVHRLVLEAWYGLDIFDGERETRHRIPSRGDNRIFNLRSGTHVENIHDRMKHAGNKDEHHCSRGHRLAGLNLVTSALARGRRQCRSCSNARAKVDDAQRRNGVDISADLRSFSHSYYERFAGQTLATLQFAAQNPLAVARRRVVTGA